MTEAPDRIDKLEVASAIALFFGGIGQVFKGRGTRVALFTVAGLALVAGLLRIVSLPMQAPGLGPPTAG